MAQSEDDVDSYRPLEGLRVFGAGIKRKRVRFVRSSDITLDTTAQTTSSESEAPERRIATSSEHSPASVAEKYLSIVLPQEAKKITPPRREENDVADRNATNSTVAEPGSGSASTSIMVVSPAILVSERQDQRGKEGAAIRLCDVCSLPVGVDTNREALHEASIVHQVCLAHSHPPSHLDRTRHGLRYLVAYGWDPDSRLGLGAPGREGIREPIKPKVKNDTVGLGMAMEPRKEGVRQKAVKMHPLNAKQVRRGDLEAKRKSERLRDVFYRRDDVQRYLGDGE